LMAAADKVAVDASVLTIRLRSHKDMVW
jgi:hypothetical protein